MLPNPINLQAWIEEHRHLLKPPVGNKCIVDGDYIVMIVGGPNARTDYHYEDGPEFFHQLEGEMVLRIQEHADGEPGAVRDIPIKAGEMFYLPPRIRIGNLREIFIGIPDGLAIEFRNDIVRKDSRTRRSRSGRAGSRCAPPPAQTTLAAPPARRRSRLRPR